MDRFIVCWHGGWHQLALWDCHLGQWVDASHEWRHDLNDWQEWAWETYTRLGLQGFPVSAWTNTIQRDYHRRGEVA